MPPTYYRTKELLETPIDDDRVLMDPDCGSYFALNSVASVIWELLKSPHTTDELVASLLNQYDISESVCRSEVTAFIDQLVKKNLLKIMP